MYVCLVPGFCVVQGWEHVIATTDDSQGAADELAATHMHVVSIEFETVAHVMVRRPRHNVHWGIAAVPLSVSLSQLAVFRGVEVTGAY